MIRLSSKLLLRILENGPNEQMHIPFNALCLSSIFKTIKVLSYMEVITEDYLRAKLFLSPVNSIVPIYELYLFKNSEGIPYY